MGNSHRYITVLIFFIYSFQLFGQRPGFSDTSFYFSHILDVNPRYYRSHDTVWIYTGLCKTLRTQMFTGNQAIAYLNEQESAAIRVPFLTAHGTVQYDFTYRSFVDTPFSQKDFVQHSIQASVDLLIRDRYPLRLVIASRRSNSPYFDNVTDVNVQFKNSDFLNTVKEKLRKKLPETINTDKLSELENMYQQKQWEVKSLEGWLNHPARLQEIIEAKEKLAARAANTDTRSQLPGAEDLKKRAFNFMDAKLDKIRDSINAKADSLIAEKKSEKDSSSKSGLLAQYQQKKDSLEKALQQLKSYDQKLKNTRNSIQDSVAQFRSQLARITDPAALKDFIHQHNLDSKDLPKGWQTLSIINTIGLGRTWVDYSDLTVKNISLTGINTELTPSGFYFAFAAGKVNYRFRDFVIKNNDRPKQSLYLLRAGIGKKEGNNFILTWYDGKKSLLNSFGNTIATGRLERVIGVSAESRLQVDANNYIVFEAAKSSFHNAGTMNPLNEGLMNKVWDFKNRSNEAYSIKLNSFWPQTDTKIIGYYRKMGDHFQSFNLQPVNVNQEAYQLKVQQSFLKRKLIIDAGIRKNDFNSPFINPGLSSKTVFKSLQATLRIPKYPFISVGYYPSSQLTVMDNNLVVENQYNTLSAVAGHAYRIGNIGMSSNAVFLKFYNSGADTGFIYYNASSWTVNQYIFLKSFQLQTGLTLTSQRELKVVTLEQSISCQVRQWLTLSGGIKYNQVNQADILWGGTAGLGVIIKKIGTIQASYDKSFLPGTYRNLLPVDMGKVSYYRTF